MLLGGAFGWGVGIATALAGLSALAAAGVAWREGGLPPAGWVAGLVLLGVLWTLVQLLPLPATLTAALQPEAVAQREVLASLLGTAAPAFVPLTLSPGGTALEAVKGLAIAASFLAAWILVVRGERVGVLVAVGASVTAMALTGLVHGVAGAERVFGVYAPRFQASVVLAPLVNPNHFAGFLDLGIPVLVGLALHARARWHRAAYGAAAAVSAGVCIASLSRGGILGLLVGGAVLGLLALRRRRSLGSLRNPAALGVAVLLLGGVGFGITAALDGLLEAFGSQDASKLALAVQGATLALDHPWVGVGRGAFSAAFVTRYTDFGRATRPENLVVQWTSEWGLPVGLLLFGGLVALVLVAAGRARSWPRIGAVAGLAALVVHDMVDFATEMVGVAVVAAALLAAVVAPRTHRRSGGSPRPWRPVALAGAVGLLAVVIGAAGASRLDGLRDLELQDRLTEQLLERDRGAFRQTLESALRRHPREPAFLMLAGAEAVRHGDPAALPWLNQAMRVAPDWSSPHVEVARYLFLRGRVDQALIELRAAEELRPGAGAPVACRWVRTPAQAERLIQTARPDAVGDRFLDRTAACLGPSPIAEHLDAYLVERGIQAARVRTADRRLRGGRPREALEALEGASPEEPTVARVAARAWLEAGEPERALATLGAVAGRPTPSLLRLVARAHAAAGDADAMRRSTARLRGLARGRADRVAASWLLEGQLEESLGRTNSALSAYERAHRLDPSGGGLEQVLRLAADLGDLPRALRAARALCQRGVEGACAREQRLRRRLAEPRPPSGQPPDGRSGSEPVP